MDFPDAAVAKNPPLNAGDVSLIPDPGGSQPRGISAHAPQCGASALERLASSCSEHLDNEGSASQEKSQQGEARAPRPEPARSDEGPAQLKTEAVSQ